MKKIIKHYPMTDQLIVRRGYMHYMHALLGDIKCMYSMPRKSDDKLARDLVFLSDSKSMSK